MRVRARRAAREKDVDQGKDVREHPQYRGESSEDEEEMRFLD
jgi:hypothetical protein